MNLKLSLFVEYLNEHLAGWLGLSVCQKAMKSKFFNKKIFVSFPIYKPCCVDFSLWRQALRMNPIINDFSALLLIFSSLKTTLWFNKSIKSIDVWVSSKISFPPLVKPSNSHFLVCHQNLAHWHYVQFCKYNKKASTKVPAIFLLYEQLIFERANAFLWQFENKQT